MPGAMPLAASEAPRQMRFESAKMATAQRAVSNVAVADSLSVAVSRDAARSTRRVDARTFVLRDSVWTDVRYRPDMTTTQIKPFSKAYFDLIAELPELKSVFALGPKVIAVGKDRAISLSDRGAESLSRADLAAIARAW